MGFLRHPNPGREPQKITIRQLLAKHLGDLAQQLITLGMAVHIVDALEVIDVDHQQCQRT